MTNFELIRQLLTDFGKYFWKKYVLAFLFMALIAATTATTAWLIKDVVDKVFVSKNSNILFLFSGLVLSIFLAKGLATYGQQVILASVSNSIVANIQNRICSHILTWDITQFNERNSSDFIARQAFITKSAGNVLNILITAFAKDFLTLIGLICVMLIQDPIITLIALFSMPISLYGVRRLSTKAKTIAEQEFYGFSLILENIQDIVQGIKVIKSFTLERIMKEKQQDAVRSIRRAANKLSRVGASSSPLMETMGGIAVAIIIFYGGWRVSTTGKTPGEFFSLITALLLAYEPAKRLARMNIELSSSFVGVRMLYEFLGTPGKDPPDNCNNEINVPKGLIEFQNVSFDYGNGSKPLFKNVFLRFNPGETTALIGRSGAGKSSLFSLILHFYKINSGSILIDGCKINEVNVSSLRAHISYVMQDTFLLKGTVLDNIRIGNSTASEEEVIQASKMASAHDFIEDLPNGYHTVCGENGATLSGGQKQRIALARAFLKNSPILLLDEATSALDSETENEIKLAIDRLRQGRTTIVIAHRLSTIINADKIIVLEKGVVMQEGTHSELIKKNGIYKNMFDLQFNIDF